MADNFQTTFQVLVQGLSQAQKYAQALNAIANAQGKVVASAQGINSNMPKITSGLTYLDQAGNKVTRTVATVNGQLVEMATHVDSTGKKSLNAAQQVDSLTRSWGLLTRVMIGSLIARGVGLVISSLKEGMQTAMEFNLRVGEIQTISQNVSVSTDQWTQSIRRLSDTYGQGLLDTAEGMYQTISNQTARGVEATYFLAEAQKFAVISVTDTANAVELLSGSLNAYGESADKADEYSAILFKTIELGRLRAEDISNSLGRVTSVASQLNVPMAEVSATLATMTRQGVKANEAMTYLRNIFQKLIRPSDHMKEIFKQWGVASGAAAIKTFGFVDVMQKLNAIADESGDPVTELGDQWQRIRSIVGALSLKNSKDWLNDVEAISNASDDAAEALKRMQATPAYQLNKELTQIKNMFTVDLGNEIIKTFAAINASGLDFSDTLKEILTAGLRLGAFTVVIVGLTAAFVRLRAASTAAFASNPALWAILAASAAYEVTTAFWEMQEGITDASDASIAASQEFFGEIRKNAINMSTDVGDATQKMLDRQITEFDQASAKLRGIFNEYQSLADTQRDIAAALYESTQKYGTPLQKMIGAQREFEKQKSYGLKLIKEGDYEEALKVAKVLQSIADSMQKTGRLPFSPALSIPSLPPGASEFRNGLPAEMLQKQYQQQTEQFLRQMQAKAMEQGDFTQVTPGTLKGRMEEFDQAKEKVGDFTNKIKDQTARLAEYRTNAVEYARQIKEAFDRMTAKTGVLDQNMLAPTAGNGWTFPAGFQDQVKNFSAAQKTLTDLFAAQAKSGQGFTVEQAEQIRVTVLQLVASNAALQAMGANLNAVSGWPKELEGMLKGMAEAANYFVQQSQAAQTGESKLKELANMLPNAANAVDNIYTSILLAEGGWEGFGATGKQKLDTLNLLMNDLNTKLWAFLETANNAYVNGPTPPLATYPGSAGKVTGGLIKRFAAGGSVGSDSIAAMLSPGEFVTNRASTRKFLPLLSAMNSGSTRMASGGAVTNNVGDVNVTVQGGDTSEATVRQIGNALRRELKRGNIRLS